MLWINTHFTCVCVSVCVQYCVSLWYRVTQLSLGSFADFFSLAAAAAKSLQSCLTLCDPIDGSPPGSTVPGILQARTLECVAISFSSAWKWKVKGKSLSCVQLLATPWTATHQARPSMGFSRQEYWSGVPLEKGWVMYIEKWNYEKCQVSFQDIGKDKK